MPRAQTAFGLHVDRDALPSADDLHARAIEHLRGHIARMDATQRASLAETVRHLGLPLELPVPSHDEPALILHIELGVRLEDPDTFEPVTDPAALRAFDGWDDGGADLAELACCDPFASLLWGEASLRFDSPSGTLRCRVSFALAEIPDAGEEARLRAMVTDALFDTSWGWNVEWEPPEAPLSWPEHAVHVTREVLAVLRET